MWAKMVAGGPFRPSRYSRRVARPRLLDRTPQRGLLRYWFIRAGILGSAAIGTLAVAQGRADVWTVIVGAAVVACCFVTIVRALVRGDLTGGSLVDDW